MDTIRVIYCALPKGTEKVLFNDSKGYILLVNSKATKKEKATCKLVKSEVAEIKYSNKKKVCV